MISPGVKLPDSVDLLPYWVNAKYPQPNQEEIGDCTAETMAFDVALMKLKQGTYIAPFSVAYAYAKERQDIGTFPADSGANMVDEGNALAKHGICFESTMPTSGTSCNKVPSAAAEAEAANFKCDPNQTPIDYRDFQLALFNCQQNLLLGSVRMGYPVPESIQNAVYNGGWVSVPDVSESLLGGHSELEGSYEMLKGPNDKAPRLYVSFLQSWGNTGDMSKGLSLFHFPYPEFFESAWVQAEGGTDNYQQPDLPGGPSHVCPAGQHWDEAQQKCVPDEPTDCYTQDLKCQQDVMSKFTAFWDLFWGKLGCLEEFFICTFTLAGIRKLINAALGKKLSMTMTRKMSKIGINISVTISKPKTADW
jgi:hypothetical protein